MNPLRILKDAMTHPLDPLNAESTKMLNDWLSSRSYKSTFEDPGTDHKNYRLSDLDLISLAQKTALPFGLPASWANPPTRRYESSRNYSFASGTARTGSAEACKACLASGLDPWLELMRGRGSAPPFSHYFLRLIAPNAMAELISADCPTIAGAISLAKQAASFAPAHGAEHASTFVKLLAQNAAAAAGSSLQGAAGIMGDLDRKAKRCAQVLIASEAELMAIAGNEADQAEFAKAIAKSRRFCDIKSQAAAFDPAKSKKNLTPEKRERLLSIMLLAARSHYDDGSASMVILGTPWLSEEPNALCIGIKTQQSAMASALAACADKTLSTIESLGSNIWIASAQANESNACAWAARYCHHNPEAPSTASVARMLAYGAHLDGASDPVQYALTKLEEARAAHSYDPKSYQLVCDRLKSELEAIAFTQLLADREEDALERAEDAARPRRHRL